MAAEVTFYSKTQGEWAAFRKLTPWVRGLLCRGPVSRRFLIAMRAMPLHVLGVMPQPAWADGLACSRAQFFFHDLDHARYKIREDILALGHQCPDVSPETPAILATAAGAVRAAGPRLWELAPQRLRLAHDLFARMDALADQQLAAAIEWLLFEIIHEKSFPLDQAIIRRELRDSRHIQKLERKLASGFFQEANPRVFEKLDEARIWLLEVL